MKWAIYYSDRSIFTSDDGEPWDAPRLGVQVIFEAHSHNVTEKYSTCNCMDYFYYEEAAGGFSSTDQFGFYDHLIRERNPCPFFGRMLSNKEWKACFDWAKLHWLDAHPEYLIR